MKSAIQLLNIIENPVGKYQDNWGTSYSFYKKEIGQVKITSGKIVVSDPCQLVSKGFFVDYLIPKGEYSVEAYVTKISSNTDTENKELNEPMAFVVVQFSQYPIKDCKLGLRKNELMPKDDSYYGFGADSGYGAIYDAEFASEVLQSVDWNKEEEIYDKFITKSNKNLLGGGSWASVSYKNKNMVGFSSGYGDGHYPVYWCLDKSNQPTGLIIDFLVVPQDLSLEK